MEFEDILVKVGDYGKYQKKLLFLFLFPAAALLPWFSMNIMFLVSVPDHWCRVPELEPYNLTIAEQQELIRPPFSDPKCTTYDVNYTEILSSENWTIPEDANIKPCTHGWVYDTTNYDSTAASHWNMVCDDSHYTSLVLTLANVGSVLGTPIYGALSDKIGRKPTFFLTVVVTAVTAIASVLMSNFIAFQVLRAINGSLMPSIFQLPYIILVELVGPDMRTRMNGIANMSWTFGLCFLPLLAWLTRDWVTLGLVTSSVTVIFFGFYRLLPESPRWLVGQERYDEAAAILTEIGKTNGQEQDPKELLQQVQKLGERMQKEAKATSGEETSVFVFFKYPQLRKRFLIVTYCWFANCAVYYGLQLNVGNLIGNEFLNFFLLSLAEAPGALLCWMCMAKIGRRWSAVCSLTGTGLVCLLPFIFPEEWSMVAVVSSFIGKFGASASFMAVYQQGSELYPTVIRALGMGLSGTVGCLALIIMPYVVHLSLYGKFIPFVIVAFMCITAGLFASFLPETLNENLPQTIMDAESFGKNQKFFSCTRRRRPSCHEDWPRRSSSVGNVELKKY